MDERPRHAHHARMAFYHADSRSLQDRFDTRRLADRIEELLVSDRINDGDRAFIESVDMFFLATTDDEGRPNCSYKGGEPGFVRVLDERNRPLLTDWLLSLASPEHLSPYSYRQHLTRVVEAVARFGGSGWCNR